MMGHVEIAVPFNYAPFPSSQAALLRKQGARIREHVRSTTEAIIEIGRDLLAVKQNLDHGQFGAWVEAECGFTLRSAQRYIGIAEFVAEKNDTVSLLPPAALYKLAAKSAPPAVVQAVIEKIDRGAPVNVAEIDDALAEA